MRDYGHDPAALAVFRFMLTFFLCGLFLTFIENKIFSLLALAACLWFFFT